MRASTAPLIKLLTAGAMIGAIALLVYSKSGLGAPREADRVTAVDGSFSIIKPHGWLSQVYKGAPDNSWASMVEIYPDKSIGLGEKIIIWQRRYKPEIEKVDPQGQSLKEFQNQKLWIHVKKSKSDYVIHMLFERPEHCWYDMEVHLDGGDDLINTKWWPFVQTFECQPTTVSPTTAPTSQFSITSP